MNSNLQIAFEFKLTRKKELILAYDIFYELKKISLQLQDLMHFLYQNEANLSKADSDFLFFVSKVTKKLSFDNEFVLGINYDEDMCLFLHKVLESDIPCLYKDENGSDELDTISPLPLDITVNQSGLHLLCTPQNQEALLMEK